jgi:hypothetical protein
MARKAVGLAYQIWWAIWAICSAWGGGGRTAWWRWVLFVYADDSEGRVGLL